MGDTLGDRLKGYEDTTRILPGIPVIARLDGKSFHTWTQKLDRPYDAGMGELMVETTKHLVSETNASMGYTQSDEITLTWYAEGKSQIFFDGKVQKMVSVLASICSVYFNTHKGNLLTLKTTRADHSEIPAYFDCRVYGVPTKEEGANVFLWRELDATKNSISMAAHSYFSGKELDGLNSEQRIEALLWGADVVWHDYPNHFKRGTFVQRRTVTRAFTTEEISLLPQMHEARKNPNLMVERRDYQVIDIPPFASVTNRVEVIYDGAEPSGNY